MTNSRITCVLTEGGGWGGGGGGKEGSVEGGGGEKNKRFSVYLFIESYEIKKEFICLKIRTK